MPVLRNIVVFLHGPFTLRTLTLQGIEDKQYTTFWFHNLLINTIINELALTPIAGELVMSVRKLPSD